MSDPVPHEDIENDEDVYDKIKADKIKADKIKAAEERVYAEKQDKRMLSAFNDEMEWRIRDFAKSHNIELREVATSIYNLCCHIKYT